MGKLDLLKVFARLLFVQALFNRRGLQNLGLASALSGARGRSAGEARDPVLAIHAEHFNTNPNLLPIIVGGILKLEEERLEGKPVGEKDIAYFKNALESPFAAMGDLLFIGGLRPLALTLACVFAIYRSPIGLVAIFLLYNLAIISCRFWGLHFGYAKGRELVNAFSGDRFMRALGVVQGIGAGVGGVLVGAVFDELPGDGRWMMSLAVALSAATWYLLKKNVPASWSAVIALPVCALLAWLVA